MGEAGNTQGIRLHSEAEKYYLTIPSAFAIIPPEFERIFNRTLRLRVTTPKENDDVSRENHSKSRRYTS